MTFDKRNKQNKRDKFVQLYGLSLWLSNGDDPIFISHDRKAIEGIDKAVTEAMNGIEGVSISLDNVNVEILNSDNVNIGGVLQE